MARKAKRLGDLRFKLSGRRVTETSLRRDSAEPDVANVPSPWLSFGASKSMS